MATAFVTSYEHACAGHRWTAPDRYDIAADVCDERPPDTRSGGS
jgi:hypothetical protein